MAHTKVSERRTKKGVASAAPNAKRHKSTGNERLGSVVTLQTQDHTDAEEMALTVMWCLRNWML